MNYFAILAISHVKNGDYCTCGELAIDCFFLQVIIPAHEITRTNFYEVVFGKGTL